MTAGVVESIRFLRFPGRCEHGGQHDRFEIRSTSGWGHVYACTHPFCDTSPWMLYPGTRPIRPRVLLTHTVGSQCAPLAFAYLLATWDVDEAHGVVTSRTQRIVARVGVCDQWQDQQWGNYGTDDEHRLFTQRYYAIEGPGVYPATIDTVENDPGPAAEADGAGVPR